MKKILSTLLIILLFVGDLYAATNTYQEGVSSYAGTSDCGILSGSTNQNKSSTELSTRAIGTEVYILHFDISDIPTTATVSAATLTLEVSEQNCTSETMEVKQIEDPDASGVFNVNASTGDTFNTYADWLYKDDSANTDWDSAASVNFTDVDDNSAEDSFVTGGCPGYETGTWDIPTMVQSWVTSPSSNAGMIVYLTNSGNVRIKSRHYATSTQRPKLSVTYTTASSFIPKVITN